MGGSGQVIGHSSPRPIVLYIAGVGRSGSTIMDTVLGSDQSCEGLGEVAKLGQLRNETEHRCGCGRVLADCPFWTSVVTEWRSNMSDAQVQMFPELQSRFEGMGCSRFRHRKDRPNAGEVAAYATQTAALFRAIASVGGRPVSVDSSKTPGRLAALAANSQIELFAVHLVRDSVGTARSLRKAIEKAPERGIDEEIEGDGAMVAAAHWVRRNVQVEAVLRRRLPRRYMRVRYEDFASDPCGVLEGVSQLVGFDLSETARRAAEGVRMRSRHSVAGNRLRLSGAVQLRSTDRQGGHLTGRDYLVKCATWPLMRHYGYR